MPSFFNMDPDDLDPRVRQANKPRRNRFDELRPFRLFGFGLIVVVLAVYVAIGFVAFHFIEKYW